MRPDVKDLIIAYGASVRHRALNPNSDRLRDELTANYDRLCMRAQRDSDGLESALKLLTRATAHLELGPLRDEISRFIVEMKS